jgi:two-component system, cell cycle sensor histidine kinase and response regulator CckA
VELGEDYAAQHLGVVPGRYVMLAVSDSGFGMDETTRSHIFEPFFTTKEKGKGTGLGLSIVYGIVKQSGGEVLVYSEPDKGTVFKLYFPLAVVGTEETQASNAEDARVTATETILLVEDETQVRNLTRAILSRQGYRILTAASPADALAIVEAATGNIDLMLTDIVMPQMNGLELAEKIRSVRPSLKVLFMSGYTDNAAVNQGILSRDMPFIQKPFTAAALHKKVREVLGG